MRTFHLRQPITSEKLAMTQSIQLAVNEETYCCRQCEAAIDLFPAQNTIFPSKFVCTFFLFATMFPHAWPSAH